MSSNPSDEQEPEQPPPAPQPAASAGSEPFSSDAPAPREPRPLGAARQLLAIALFFVLPLALRAYPLEHGMPRGYVPDAHIVRNALGMAKDKNPVPPVGRYSTYPNLLPYMLLPVYAGYYGVGLMQERWEGVEEFGDHVLVNPSEAHLLARWLAAILAALTPLFVFHAAREARLTRGAWVSGALVATCLLHVHLSTHERPWAPMSAFIALAAWGAVRHVRTATTRSLLLSGLAAGLAFATHQAGLMTLGLAGLAWACAPGSWRELHRRVGRGVLCVLVFAVVALAIGHPYLLVHGRTPTEAVVGAGAGEGWKLSIGGMIVVIDLRFETALRLSKVFVGYDPLLLVLGIAGLLAALRRRLTLPVALWTLGAAVFFLTNPSDHARYLLPVAVMLALIAAYPAQRLSHSGLGRSVLALAVIFPLLQALRFVQVLARPDTRAQAEEELYALPFGSRLAIDRYGPAADLSLPALERLKDLRHRQGAGLYARERFRKNGLASGSMSLEDEGFDIVPLEDVFEFDEREGTAAVRPGLLELGATPAELLDALGVTHLLLVKRRTSEPNLLASLVAGREPTLVIDPGAGGDAPEAFLPTEMDFPLTSLWQVERPGPRIELYALD